MQDYIDTHNKRNIRGSRTTPLELIRNYSLSRQATRKCKLKLKQKNTTNHLLSDKDSCGWPMRIFLFFFFYIGNPKNCKNKKYKKPSKNKKWKQNLKTKIKIKKCVGGNLLYFLCLISNTLPQLSCNHQKSTPPLPPATDHLLQPSPWEVNPSTHYSIYHFLNHHDKYLQLLLVMSHHHTILICNNHLEQPIRIHLLKILVRKPYVD